MIKKAKKRKTLKNVDPTSGYDGHKLFNGAGVEIGKTEILSIQSPAKLFDSTKDWPVNLCFHQGSDLVGEFIYDRDAKRWTFEGNMDEAAKQFAKFMYAHFQSLIEGDRDGLMNSVIDNHELSNYKTSPQEELEPEPEKHFTDVKVEGNFDPKLSPFRKALDYFEK